LLVGPEAELQPRPDRVAAGGRAGTVELRAPVVVEVASGNPEREADSASLSPALVVTSSKLPSPRPRSRQLTWNRILPPLRDLGAIRSAA
jgi:hypothetical protein